MKSILLGLAFLTSAGAANAASTLVCSNSKVYYTISSFSGGPAPRPGQIMSTQKLSIDHQLVMTKLDRDQ